MPNFLSLMPAWPKKIHSQEVLDEINEQIDEWMKTYNPPFSLSDLGPWAKDTNTLTVSKCPR